MPSRRAASSLLACPALSHSGAWPIMARDATARRRAAGCGRATRGMTDIPLTGEPAETLRRLGKDPRLTPYGGGNFGMPIDLLDPDGSPIVPTDRFFIRSNGPIPVIDPDGFRLTIQGAVERPLSLTLADLDAMPQREL